jgi:hypothetical protein
MMNRFRPLAMIMLPALLLAGCAVTAGGFATDFSTVRSAGVTVGTDAPAAEAWANCAAVPGQGGARRPGQVRLGMSECEVVAALGRPLEAHDSAEPDGTPGSRLVFRDAGAPLDERVYIFVGGRLVRIEG